MKYFQHVLFTLLCMFLIPAYAVENRLSPLGINTNEIMDIDTSVPFIDLFKMAMPFDEARPWLTKGRITYDQYGWPVNLNGGQAGTRFLNDFPAESIPKGVYTVLHDGHGNFRYSGNVRLVRRYSDRDLIEFQPKNGRITATIIITETDERNYLRNFRVIMPGGICKDNPFQRVNNPSECKGKYYQDFTENHELLVFNPEYLNFMKDFRVIRMMNISGITRNNLMNWDQRPKLSDATWGGKEGVRGAPLEIMIKLANIIDADPWFSLPHRANDEFVAQYARTVKAKLKPSLKAYIEYSNEAWNGIFTQAHYVKDAGVHFGLDKNRAYAGYKYYSHRSVEIFRIWEQIFGNTNRLVRVMSGMTTNVAMTHMVLGYEEAFRYVDALAIAPYFHGTQKDIRRIRSVNQVFAMLNSPNNKYSIPNTMKLVKKQADVVAQYGIDLIAYEGGQHLVAYKTHSKTEGSNAFIIAANKDKRMAKLYYDFLSGWKKAGGKLFVAFSAPREYNHIGSWGIKEHIAQSMNDAPKYQGLMSFKKNNRCWWRNCSTTGPIARQSKPRNNPGAGEMQRRFKPVVPRVRVAVVN